MTKLPLLCHFATLSSKRHIIIIIIIVIYVVVTCELYLRIKLLVSGEAAAPSFYTQKLTGDLSKWLCPVPATAQQPRQALVLRHFCFLI